MLKALTIFVSKLFHFSQTVAWTSLWCKINTSAPLTTPGGGDVVPDKAVFIGESQLQMTTLLLKFCNLSLSYLFIFLMTF